jgi:hypothetical protein
MNLNLGLTDLETLVQEVMRTLSVVEREREGSREAASTRCGCTRTSPADNRVDGVVILLVDIPRR